MRNPNRLTLIATNDTHIEWLDTAQSVAFIDSGPLLKLGIAAALNEQTLDVERLVLDRVADAETYLELLASLPSDFAGDVLRIDERGCGFLSASGRGGDRVLYALKASDVHFYLAMNDLVRIDERLEKIA